MAGQLLLSQSQLERRLFKRRDAAPIGMTALTEPDMRITNNPFAGRVAKICNVNGFINWRYSRAVNRQRVREWKPADFRALSRSWGQRVKNSPLVALVTEHGETLLYIEIKVQTAVAQFRNSETGEVIPLEALKRFLIKPAKPVWQGLYRHIVLRDYRLDHIAELRIEGEVWRIRKCWNRFQRLTNPLPGATS
jgi:hypothetical protein